MRRISYLAALVLLLSTTARTSAHALSADCKIVGGKVYVEGYYSDDTPAAFAAVRVLDPQQKIAAQGKLDSKGLWQFDRPAAGSYTIVIEADGHGKRLSIRVPHDSGYSGRISKDLTRDEFTAFPWAKVIIGVVMIGVIAVAAMIAKLSRKKADLPQQSG